MSSIRYLSVCAFSRSQQTISTNFLWCALPASRANCAKAF